MIVRLGALRRWVSALAHLISPSTSLTLYSPREAAAILVTIEKLSALITRCARVRDHTVLAERMRGQRRPLRRDVMIRGFIEVRRAHRRAFVGVVHRHFSFTTCRAALVEPMRHAQLLPARMHIARAR